MSKNNNALPAFDYNDSQRIKEAFFTPQVAQSTPKKSLKIKKKKPHGHRNKILFFTGLTTLLAAIIAGLIIHLFNRYEFVALPKYTPSAADSITLMHNPDSLIELVADNEKTVLKNSSHYLVGLTDKKNGIQLTFDRLVNLNTKKLTFYTKGSYNLERVEAVFKDKNFFSNAINPIIINIRPGEAEDGWEKIGIPVEQSLIQPVSVMHVKQIRLYFVPKKGMGKNILIKDLVIQ